MRFTPQKNGRAKVLSLLLSLIGFAMLGTAFVEIPYRALIELAGLGILTVGFELLFRYEMTTYTYILEGEDFLVLKQMGKKLTYACNLSLATGKDVIPTPRSKTEKELAIARFGRAAIRYNFCQTIRPKRTVSFFLDFNGSPAEIVLEANEAFVEKMKAEIAALQENQEDFEGEL